jgi:predicted phage terminase large subunit-like protein
MTIEAAHPRPMHRNLAAVEADLALRRAPAVAHPASAAAVRRAGELLPVLAQHLFDGLKGEQLSDFSVATVWLNRGDYCYLLDLWRQRVDYPDLRYAMLELRKRHPNATLLIEDKGSGTSLIQDLRAKNIAVVGIDPQGDKLTRAAKVSAKIEAGAVFFPKAAPWLGPLKAELLGFPNVKHDDQVDSVTQALSWISRYGQNRIPITPPIIISGPRRYFGDMPPNF